MNHSRAPSTDFPSSLRELGINSCVQASKFTSTVFKVSWAFVTLLTLLLTAWFDFRDAFMRFYVINRTNTVSWWWVLRWLRSSSVTHYVCSFSKFIFLSCEVYWYLFISQPLDTGDQLHHPPAAIAIAAGWNLLCGLFPVCQSAAALKATSFQTNTAVSCEAHQFDIISSYFCFPPC